MFQPTPRGARRSGRQELAARAAKRDAAAVRLRAAAGRHAGAAAAAERSSSRISTAWRRRRERAPKPDNPLPFSRGNSAERVEAAPAGARARARDAEPPQPPQPEAEEQRARVAAVRHAAFRRPPDAQPPRRRGALGEALRNLQRYVQNETFNNPQGGADRSGRDHPVRYQGRRVRPVAAPLRRAGAAQLVRPAGRDDDARPRRAAVQHPQGRHASPTSSIAAAVDDRRVQPRRVQRHPRPRIPPSRCRRSIRPTRRSSRSRSTTTKSRRELMRAIACRPRAQQLGLLILLSRARRLRRHARR